MFKLEFRFYITIWRLSIGAWTDSTSPKWDVYCTTLKTGSRRGWLLKVFTYRLTFWLSWMTLPQ